MLQIKWGQVHGHKNRKADFAVGAISVMAERDMVIDYSIPFYEGVGFAIMMKNFKGSVVWVYRT